MAFGKTPKIETPAPVASPDDDAAIAQGQAEADRRARRRGARSTILTRDQIPGLSTKTGASA